MKRDKEPAAIRELHRIREEMLAEEKRAGSEEFWAEANRQGREFARRHGLKYRAPGASTLMIREKRAKYGK